MEKRVRKAKLQDADAINQLVWSYAKDRLMLARPVAHINPRIRDYSVSTVDEKVIGCVALRVWDGEWAEIIALAVDNEHKMRGVGIELVNSCITEAEILGVRFVAIFTYNDELAQKAGFNKLDDISFLPEIIFTEKTVVADKAYMLEIGAHKASQ